MRKERGREGWGRREGERDGEGEEERFKSSCTQRWDMHSLCPNHRCWHYNIHNIILAFLRLYQEEHLLQVRRESDDRHTSSHSTEHAKRDTPQTRNSRSLQPTPPTYPPNFPDNGHQ